MTFNLIAAVFLAANAGWSIAFACLARYSGDVINWPLSEQEHWFWMLAAISGGASIFNAHTVNRRIQTAPQDEIARLRGPGLDDQ